MAGSKSIKKGMKVQSHHSAMPERYPAATSVPLNTDVVKVGKQAKHMGVIKALRDQGYKC